MWSLSLGKDSVIIAAASSGNRVVYLDDSILRYENGIGPQRRVFDIVFLQVAEA